MKKAKSEPSAERAPALPGEQRCSEGASCDYDRITDVWAFARLPAERRPKVRLCAEHQARIEALAKRG